MPKNKEIQSESPKIGITAKLRKYTHEFLGYYIYFQLKGTSVFSSDFSGLPCLLQLYTSLHLLDYRKVWNIERWKSFDLYFCIKDFFFFSDKNILQNGVDALLKIDDAFFIKSLWHKHL